MFDRIQNVLPIVLFVAFVLGGCSQSLRLEAQQRTFQNGAVAADHPQASEAGALILRKGGNAVDAAVATSFCLSVVRPYSCGIGGGGFMVISFPADEFGNAPAPVAVNYRETSPAAVDGQYYVEHPHANSRFGVHAVAVPGTVAGLLHVLEKYGTMDRAAVLQPAIDVARNGFVVDKNMLNAIAELKRRRNEFPDLARLSDNYYNSVLRGGKLRAGDIVTNSMQADALELIARDGLAAFTHGPIAEAIEHVMMSQDGPMARRDLAAATPVERAPLNGHFRGHTLLSMPPPSSGGIAMQQICGILDRLLPQDVQSSDDPRYAHLLTESLKHAFADRAAFLADDTFVDVPTRRLTSSQYLDDLASRVDGERTQPPAAYGSAVMLPVDGGTSHLSVIDSSGMAVAATETINTLFGSLVVVPGFGFFLNNEMDDFTTIPGAANAYGLMQSDRNLPAPGKRPLSSMSPTIVLRNGKPFIIAGASGGPRIITGTLQVMLNIMLFDMDPADAVAAPRLHHQWMPNVVQFETDQPPLDDQLQKALRLRGHTVDWRPNVGMVQCIRIDERGIHAASDPRKGGRPAGH